MSATSISPSQAVPTLVVQAAKAQAALHRSGTSHATVSLVNDLPLPVIFAVGAAGAQLDSVRVVIRDESGRAVASFALAALSGTQNVMWTPQAGTPAGAYAAYWEGSRLATEP